VQLVCRRETTVFGEWENWGVNYPRLKPWASLAGQKKEDKRICSASFLAA
jgi:hypothetical protein